MVPVADEEAELEQLEGFKGVEDDVDELGVDVLELGDFRTVIEDIDRLVSTADRDQRLVALELLKELLNGRVDDGDDIDDLPHDLILHVDVALGLDDLDIDVVVLLLIDH